MQASNVVARRCVSTKTRPTWIAAATSARTNSSRSNLLLDAGHPHPHKVIRSIRTTAALGDETKVVECPAFAESISEGDLRWEKAVGDYVAMDEVICEVETDKTSVPVPSPVAGTIVKLLVEDGATVNPKMPLAEIKMGGEAPAGGAAPPKPAAEAPAAAAAPPPPPPPAAGGAIPSTPPPTPATPSGPAASTPTASVPPIQAPTGSMPPLSSGPAPVVKMPPADPTTEIVGTRSEHRVKMNRMRLKIAQRLKDAQNTTAMLTTFNELDMSSIMQLRKENQDAFVKRHGLKLGFMSAFVKASAYALTQQPTVNAVIDGGEIVYRDYVDVSVAVATPKVNFNFEKPNSFRDGNKTLFSSKNIVREPLDSHGEK